MDHGFIMKQSTINEVAYTRDQDGISNDNRNSLDNEADSDKYIEDYHNEVIEQWYEKVVRTTEIRNVRSKTIVGSNVIRQHENLGSQN